MEARVGEVLPVLREKVEEYGWKTLVLPEELAHVEDSSIMYADLSHVVVLYKEVNGKKVFLELVPVGEVEWWDGDTKYKGRSPVSEGYYSTSEIEVEVWNFLKPVLVVEGEKIELNREYGSLYEFVQDFDNLMGEIERIV